MPFSTLPRLSMPAAEDTHRAGFVALVGRPNVGKSTLLNFLLGQKLSITTPKPQTTRNRILGIKTTPGAQMLLLDTPGIHAPRGHLGKTMVHAALGALEEADVVVLLTEIGRSRPGAAPTQPDALVLERMADLTAPVILALNKIDLVRRKSLLLPVLEAYQRAREFAALVPISAVNGTGVDALVGEIVARLPASPPLYPEADLTDRPERFFAAELVREAVITHTRGEVPYAVAVTIDRYEETPDLVRIGATIHVERESQKAIVVGKAGALIKAIGTAARVQIERLTGAHVFLDLWVRVDADWSRDPQSIARLTGQEDES